MGMVFVFFAVSILSSIAGSICGIGGGVIIKPVLDAVGIECEQHQFPFRMYGACHVAGVCV